MKMYLKPIRSVSGKIIRVKHHELYCDDELDQLWKKKKIKKFKGANYTKKQLKNKINLQYFDQMFRKKTYV